MPAAAEVLPAGVLLSRALWCQGSGAGSALAQPGSCSQQQPQVKPRLPLPSSQGSPNSWLQLFSQVFCFTISTISFLIELFDCFVVCLGFFKQYFLLPLLLNVSLLSKPVNINLSMISNYLLKGQMNVTFFYHTAGHCLFFLTTCLLECYLKLCEIFLNTLKKEKFLLVWFCWSTWDTTRRFHLSSVNCFHVASLFLAFWMSFSFLLIFCFFSFFPFSLSVAFFNLSSPAALCLREKTATSRRV